MTISDKGISIIKSFEGCVLHAYHDDKDIPTIGYGTIIYKDGSSVKIGDIITQEEADDLLLSNLKGKLDILNACLVGVTINQNQFDALSSLIYNIGTSGFRNSTVLKRVKINPLDGTIKDAFLMWNKIRVGGILQYDNGLNNRRLAEWQLYISPI